MMMQKNDLISVVMSVYNEPVKVVQECIDSILNQSYTYFEFIIINDNSKDVNIDILIKNYNDVRIRYKRNIENLGLAMSLNKGINLAKGEFIARMDADDVSFIDRLEKQLIFLKDNDSIDVVGTAALIIDKVGNDKGLFKTPLTSEQIKVTALFGVPFIHPTIMFRKKVFTELGFYYNEDFTTAQDFELWSRIVHHLNVANLEEPLLYYRQSSQQLSTVRVTEQTAFFMKAVVAQLNKLGVEVSEYQKVLLNRMCRNKAKESLNICQVVEIRKLLLEIYYTIPLYSKYNNDMLRKHLFINLATTLINYKGNVFLFNKEVIIFLKDIDINLKNSMVLYIFLIKIKLVIIKNFIARNLKFDFFFKKSEKV